MIVDDAVDDEGPEPTVVVSEAEEAEGGIDVFPFLYYYSSAVSHTDDDVDGLSSCFFALGILAHGVSQQKSDVI